MAFQSYGSFGRDRRAGDVFGLDRGLSGLGGYDQLTSNEGVNTFAGIQSDQFNAEADLAAGTLGILGNNLALKKEMEFLKKMQEKSSGSSGSKKSGFGRIAGSILGTVVSGGNPLGGTIGGALGGLLPF